jgi:hypothetical protein
MQPVLRHMLLTKQERIHSPTYIRAHANTIRNASDCEKEVTFDEATLRSRLTRSRRHQMAEPVFEAFDIVKLLQTVLVPLLAIGGLAYSCL